MVSDLSKIRPLSFSIRPLGLKPGQHRTLEELEKRNPMRAAAEEALTING
jgi:hypothetical protein